MPIRAKPSVHLPAAAAGAPGPAPPGAGDDANRRDGYEAEVEMVGA